VSSKGRILSPCSADRDATKRYDRKTWLLRVPREWDEYSMTDAPFNFGEAHVSEILRDGINN
jgi:hypothetical protein